MEEIHRSKTLFKTTTMLNIEVFNKMMAKPFCDMCEVYVRQYKQTSLICININIYSLFYSIL